MSSADRSSPEALGGGDGARLGVDVEVAEAVRAAGQVVGDPAVLTAVQVTSLRRRQSNIYTAYITG